MNETGSHRGRRRTIGAAGFLAAVSLLVSGVLFGADRVRVETGLLSGVAGKNPSVRVYKGVPYAKPPVGELRWRAPLPMEKWEGIRAADTFAPMAMQTPPPSGSFMQKEFFPEPQPISEDCLYLNVWTAASAPDERRPVMVWLHGGGFSIGAGSQPAFDGEGLAARGAVVVTVNYRLGPFGFLAHPALSAESEHGASGNYGLLDQIAALRWVQRNIAAFGGDPANVTLFGQSAGGVSIQLLMISPHAKGLFHRAIAQSGSVFTMDGHSRFREAEAAGAKFAEAMGASTIKELRKIPAAQLLDYRRLPKELLSWPALFAFPTVDGYVVPTDALTGFSDSKQLDIPLIVGSTSDEAATLSREGGSLASYRSWVAQTYGPLAADFEKVYPATSDTDAWLARTGSMTDRAAWGARAWAELHARTSGAQVFVYRFERRPPGPDSLRYGAFHMADIVYAFNSLGGSNHPWTATDGMLANAMSAYWIAFAKTGRPDAAGLPDWRPYAKEGDPVMRLGDAVWGESLAFDAAKRRLFDRHLERTRAHR